MSNTQRDIVIMLDHQIEVYPQHWPIVVQADSISAALACDQFDALRETRPRADWTAARKRACTLVDVKTGQRCPGAVYEMRPRRPGRGEIRNSKPSPRSNAANKLARVAVAVLVSAVFAQGCAGPQLSRRYAQATDVVVPGTNAHAQVSAYVLAEELPETNPFLLSLGAQGQGSFIKAVSDKTEAADDFVAALVRGLSMADTAAKTGQADRTRFTKRVVLTISHGMARAPADRLERVSVRLTAPTNGRFVSWDKFQTRYETVELGSVKRTDAGLLEWKLGAKLPGGLIESEDQATYQSKREWQEELALRQRYTAVTGALSDKTAELALDGAIGIDLAGNVAVDLVLAATAAPHPHPIITCSPLRRADEWLQNPSAVVVNRLYLTYPARTEPLAVTLTGQYVYRAVGTGAATLTESDDTVRFLHGALRGETVELVGLAELETRVWALRTPAGELIYIDPLGVLEFASHGEAAEVLGWLLATGNSTLGGYALKVGGATGPVLDKVTTAGLAIYVRQINRN